MIKAIIALLLVYSAIALPKGVTMLNVTTKYIQKRFDYQLCNRCYYNGCNETNAKANLPQTRHFKPEQITGNKFGIKDIEVYSSEASGMHLFRTMSMNISMRYTAFMPNTNKPILGVVLYFHSELFGKLEVPTNLQERVLALGGLYASQNYAVVFPNLAGYSNLTNEPHPYLLYPQQNAQSGAIVLNALLKERLAAKYHTQGTFNLFSAGYGAGAAYALWFDHCVSNSTGCPLFSEKLSTSYKMKGTAGLSGPYALADIVLPFLKENVGVNFRLNEYQIEEQFTVNVAKPALLALLLSGYTYYERTGTLAGALVSGFYNMNCEKGIDQEECNTIEGNKRPIPNVLSGLQNSFKILSAIGYSAFGKQNSPYTYLSKEPTDYVVLGSRNSILALTNNTIVQSPAFEQAFQAAQAIDVAPVSPTFLFTLERDSVFSPNNTARYVYKNRANAKVHSVVFSNKNYQSCQYRNTRDVDHHEVQILANVFALAFFNNITSPL